MPTPSMAAASSLDANAAAPAISRAAPSGAGSPQLHSLQYLRAIAALAVVYVHAIVQVPEFEAMLPEEGAFGVDLFFVISGFVMVYIMRPEDTALGFARKRVRRVVPLYWFFTVLLAVVLVVAPNVFRTTEVSGEAVVKSLLFVPYYADFGNAALQPLLIPGWTLNYEMYFYALFSASLLFPHRYRVTVAVLAISLVFCASRLSGSDGAIASFYGGAIAFEFVLGMLLGLAWRRGLRLPVSWAVAATCIGAVLLVVLDPPPLPDRDVRLFHYGLPSALVVAGVLCLPLPRWRLGVLLGDASYALYLSHLFTLGALRESLAPVLGRGALSAAAFIAASLIASTLVGVFTHVLLERGLLAGRRPIAAIRW